MPDPLLPPVTEGGGSLPQIAPTLVTDRHEQGREQRRAARHVPNGSRRVSAMCCRYWKRRTRAVPPR